VRLDSRYSGRMGFGVMRRSTCFLAVAWLLSSGAVRAQPTDAQPSVQGSAASSRAVTDPELVEFVPAEYPAEARERGIDATVVLVLTIDTEGLVSSAEVLEPAGRGFDEAAVLAAKRFRFKPARRGDRPVRSKLVYRYRFELKPVAAAAAPVPVVPVFTGRVQVAEGEAPLVGAKVKVFSGERLLLELVTSGTGDFRTDRLPPGAYRVVIEAEGFEPFTASEVLSEGEEVQAAYRLAPKNEEDGLTVVVRGTRPSREVTRRALSRRELSRVPGTSGDALRAIQNLPGVARPPALSGELVVRGNADQTTPVFVDGLWLPNIYHFGGLSSVVPTEMLDEINFYPGNFSVRYGRALAGVVDAHLRETREDGRYHGLLQLDLIDARAMLEGPIPGAKGWSFIGGVRRSHVDAWLIPLLENRDTQITASPRYYDYQLIADTRPSPKSYLRIGLLGFDDRFRAVDESAADSGTADLANASVGVGVIYQFPVSSHTSAEITMSVARAHQRFVFGNIRAETTALGILGRGELTHRLTPRATLRTGYDLLLAPYTASGRVPEDPGAGAPDVGPGLGAPSRVFDHSSNFFFPAVYAELSMVPSSRTQVVSGVRGDFSYESRRFDVSPRMSARYVVVPGERKTTLKGGSGLFHQAAGLFEVVLSDDPKELRSQRAWQNSLGVEQELTDHLLLSVEGFLNLLDNQITRGVNERGVLTYSNLGTGRIFGGELMLRYSEDENFFGWISYTLSRSERTWRPGEPSELFALDQPHILTLLGSYSLGRGWELGARFRYVSGNSYTPCTGGIFSSTQTAYLCLDDNERRRLPPFHQLDVRIDKRWVFDAWNFGVYLDVINVYNRINPDFIEYNFDYTQSRSGTASLPIVPSLGLRGEF
jgi:TonB family protein